MTAYQVVLDAFQNLLKHSGESHDGVHDTPVRAANAWIEKTRGYGQHPTDVLRSFINERSTDKRAGMIVVQDIEFESMCEHHLERVWGLAYVAYIPHKHVLGLSKFSRLIDVYARRLQLQERLTHQIADAIEQYLQPVGVGVVLVARHGCMEARGIQRRGQRTTTSEMRGCFYDEDNTRAEFLKLINTNKEL